MNGGFPRPERILELTPEEADELLDRLERAVPVRPGFVEIPTKGFTEALVFGDTHGDWRTTLEIERGFMEPEGGPRCLIGLGDYVDRTPSDCETGSVVNALLLLGLAAQYPDRVFLLQGNHETGRRIPFSPQSLDEEVDERWGPQADRHTRLLALLERGPFAAASTNGAYFAHAGFPRGPLPASWRRVFEDVDETRLLELVWARFEATRGQEGMTDTWSAKDLIHFLSQTQHSIFLRGHDPDLTGQPLCGGRCLSLNSTRVFERYGGVLAAHVPFGRALRSVADVRVEHLATEGRRFPALD